MRSIVNSALVLATLLLLLPACSTQPGGSEDPAGFKAGLTPSDAAAPAAPAQEAAPDSNRLADIEAKLAQAEQRIAQLEQSFEDLKQTIAAIEQTASQAMEKAANPLAGVDVEDDEQVGKALMKQSLEQIIGISRLLLDKMQTKIDDLEQSAPQAEPAPEPELQ